MAVPFLIIDGYNLLHAAGLGRVRYAPGDLERARHRLLALLCEKLSPVEQMRCTVVFDAGEQAPDAARERRHHEIRVLFAPPGFEADDLIEHLIAEHSSPKQLVVVSADHRIQKAAARRHARPVDSNRFWDRLQRRSGVAVEWDASDDEKVPALPVGNQPLSAATTLWLQEFGDVSVERLAQEVRAEESTHTVDPWLRHVAELEQTLKDPQQQARFVEGKPPGRRGGTRD
jgi:predicted RNA-binding protein with PIN domain